MAIKTVQVGPRVAVGGGDSSGIIAYNPNYPDAISRQNWEKHGERPSVKDYGAKGDTRILADGAITATDATFTSASAAFTAGDVGKTINIAGAGTDGRALGTTIASFTDANTVELTDVAVTTVSGAEFAYGTDDTTAFNDAIAAVAAVGRGLFVPACVYTIAGSLLMKDLRDFSFIGDGEPSILLASQTLPDGTNLIDVSGSNRLVLADFQIDGRFAQRTTVALSAVYGDGTEDNPEYGNIETRNVTLYRWENQGFGVGANVDMTVHDVTYVGLKIIDFGGPLVGAHPIDTGSGGTKRNFYIGQCRINFQQQPASEPLNGIFCGHGTNQDFTVEGNIVIDCPFDAIQFYSRTFVGENCSFRGLICRGNTAIRPRENGIGIYGVKHAVIEGNRVINAGQRDPEVSARAGIYVVWGYQDGAHTTPDPCEHLTIVGNTLTDDQVSPTMEHGILVASTTGAVHSAFICSNRITGQTGQTIAITPDDGEHRCNIISEQVGNKRGIAIGAAKPRANEGLLVRGDIRHEQDGTEFDAGRTIFGSMVIDSAGAAGNYLQGHGFNVRFDLDTGNWVSGYDGANNGFVFLGVTQADSRVRFYGKKTAAGGTAAQTISAAGLEAYRWLTFDPDGLVVTRGGDLRFAQYTQESLFVSPSLESRVSNFTIGFGMNIRYDPATSNWVSGNDGANNGFGYIGMSYGGGGGEDGSIRFFTKGTTGAANQSVSAATFATLERMRIDKNGNLGVGVFPPRAGIHIRAGSATAQTAPLKFSAGTLMASAEPGAIEFDGPDLWFTSNLGIRRKFLLSGGLGQQIQVSGIGTSVETLDLYDVSNTPATAQLTFTNGTSDGETVTIDGITYTYKTTLTGAAYEVWRDSAPGNAAYNLVQAINDNDIWEGYLYGNGTAAHPGFSASLSGNVVTITYRTGGTAGNGKSVSETCANASWNSGTTSGGAAGTNPHKYLRVASGRFQIINSAFTNNILDISDDGTFWVKGAASAARTDAAVFGEGALRFKQGSGEHADSGSIQYSAGGLVLYGVGTGAANRKIILNDAVGIGTAPLTTAGTLMVGTAIGVGVGSITAGRTMDVSGTAKFNTLDVTSIYMGTLTASTPLKIGAGKFIENGLISLTTDVSGVLPIGSGGTGAATAGGALTSLGAAAASHGHVQGEITGLVEQIADFEARISALEGA